MPIRRPRIPLSMLLLTVLTAPALAQARPAQFPTFRAAGTTPNASGGPRPTSATRGPTADATYRREGLIGGGAAGLGFGLLLSLNVCAQADTGCSLFAYALPSLLLGAIGGGTGALLGGLFEEPADETAAPGGP